MRIRPPLIGQAPFIYRLALGTLTPNPLVANDVGLFKTDIVWANALDHSETFAFNFAQVGTLGMWADKALSQSGNLSESGFYTLEIGLVDASGATIGTPALFSTYGATEDLPSGYHGWPDDGSGGTNPVSAATYNVTHAARAGGVATLTVGLGHLFYVGQTIIVSDIGAPYDGGGLVTAIGANTVSYAISDMTTDSGAVAGHASFSAYYVNGVWVGIEVFAFDPVSSTLSVTLPDTVDLMMW